MTGEINLITLNILSVKLEMKAWTCEYEIISHRYEGESINKVNLSIASTQPF
jgi:hypothetical protein